MATGQKMFTHVKHDGNPSLPLGFAVTAEWAAQSIDKQSGPFIVIHGAHVDPAPTKSAAIKLVREVLGRVAVGVSVHVRSASSSEMLKMRRIPLVPSYLDPFRDANISAARINGGVDYCGSGPVYPFGNAVILNVGRPSGTSTFGGDMAVYELLDGPGQGLKVFFAEHYRTRGGYANGDHVTVDDVLWDMYSCIEIGWSDGRGSVAWDSADHSIEGERTAYGENMNDLLVAVGSVAGLATGRPITGPLPAAYPRNWKELLAA